MDGQIQPASPIPPMPTPPAFVPQPSGGGGISWKIFIAALGVCAILLVAMTAALYWWYQQPAEESVATLAPISQTAEFSLGSDLFEKSANPISSTLPEAPASVSSPLEDAYQNPFQ